MRRFIRFNLNISLDTIIDTGTNLRVAYKAMLIALNDKSLMCDFISELRALEARPFTKELKFSM